MICFQQRSHQLIFVGKYVLIFAYYLALILFEFGLGFVSQLKKPFENYFNLKLLGKNYR
jgi:hypothetical protein